MLKVCEVRALPRNKIWVRYEDGIEGEVDLTPYVGKGIFSAWNDPVFFATVHLTPYGSIAWSEDIELCPDSIYLELTNKKPEEVFPRILVADVDA